MRMLHQSFLCKTKTERSLVDDFRVEQNKPSILNEHHRTVQESKASFKARNIDTKYQFIRERSTIVEAN